MEENLQFQNVQMNAQLDSRHGVPRQVSAPIEVRPQVSAPIEVRPQVPAPIQVRPQVSAPISQTTKSMLH